jgi:hypothetical protein
MTYNKTLQQVRIYRDGVLDSQTNGIPSPNPNTVNNLFIGKDSANAYNGYYFHGMMDDVRIYNRALSETEIQQLAGIQPPKCDGITTGLVLCLSGGENAWDGSGNRNHGLIQGVVPTPDRFGNPNGAYKLDGGDYIQVPNSPSINISGNLTVSAWIRSSGTPQHSGLIHKEPLVSSGNRVTGYQVSVNKGAGEWAIGIYDSWPSSGGASFSPTKVVDGNWHHLVAVYDWQTITIYTDGIKSNSVPYTKGMLPNDRPLYIGVDPDLWGGRDFHGDIDDVRIYNRALPQAEVQQLAGIQPPKCDGITAGLVLCLPLGENAWDGSGNGNHGLIQGVVVPTQDRFGKPDAAYKLDGSAYIQVPNSPSINIAGNITASAWIRSSGTAQHSALFHKLEGTGRFTGWQTSINSYEGNNWRMGIWDSWPSSGGSVPSLTKVVDGNWHHLVAVYDGQTITTYTDGIKDNSVPYTKGMLPNDRPLYIGVDPDVWGSAYWGPRNFRGDLDDVRIYNRALSEAEVKQLAGIVEPAKVTLTVAKTGNGQVTGNGITCGTDCTEDLAPNTQVTLTATATTGSMFKQWTGDCTGTTATVTVTMDKAKSCTATFELLPTYTLNVTKTGNGNVKGTGIDCGTDCTEANLAVNTQVTLTATPDAGYQFVSWAGACTGTTTTTTVTLTADQTCQATFAVIPPPTGIPLTVNKADADRGRISGLLRGETATSLTCDNACQTASYTYPKDGVVILTATPDKGFIFKDWTCTGSNYTPGTQPSTLKLTMTVPTTCTANFDRGAGFTLTLTQIGTGKGLVTSQPAGMNCTDPTCTAFYATGQKVILKAQPSPFATFVAWGGDCTGKTVTSATLTLTKNLNCTVQFQSTFEIAAADLVSALYTDGFLKDNADVASQFPQTTNQDRLKDALWLALTAILQANSHLAATQQWPTQLTGINWYSPTPISQYTQSIQLQAGEYIDIRLKLLDQTGTEQDAVIVIYYGTTPPTSADSSSGRQSIPIYFPASFFKRW